MKQKRILLKSVFIGYCAAIIFLSVYPVPAPRTPEVPLDKIMHAVAYFILGALAAAVFQTMGRSGVRIRAFVFTLGFGITIECIQYFLPFRSFDWIDMACNVAGSALGILAVSFVQKKKAAVR